MTTVEPTTSNFHRRAVLKFSLLAGATGAAANLVSLAPAKAAPLQIPKLLKDCNAAEIAERANVLLKEQRIYQWSMDVGNVEGIPMVHALPVGESPSIDWAIEFLDNFIDLLQNLAESAINKIFPDQKAGLQVISQQIHAVEERFWAKVNEYNAILKKYESRDLHAGLDAADRVLISVLAGFFLGLIAELQELRRKFFIVVEDAWKAQRFWLGDIGEKKDLQKYQDMWATLPIPEVDDYLHDDDFFAFARVAGPNPLVLRGTTTLPEALEVDLEKFAASAGESLEKAQAEGRLYHVDYAMLGNMAKEDATFKLLTGDNYNTAPIALFIRPADSKHMRPVVIQIGQNRGTSPVFYAPQRGTQKTSEYWGWQMAKTVVQTADFNHHEMFSHLGETHLISEAFCIATHRQLPLGHPLRELLEPHFEGDLYINNLAAAIIMGPYTIGDMVLAAPQKDIAGGAAQARLNWNFTDRMPTRDFADRGVDSPDLEYPYRDDALSVWEETYSWVSSYIDVYYKTDADVAEDAEMSAWGDEVINEGKVAGFNKPQTIDALKEAISMVIFTASAQHAAVNYLQRDQMTYAPYYAGTLANLPDRADGNYSESDWFNMLPTFLSAFAQMYFLNVLGAVYYRRLGDYRKSTFPHPPALTDARVQTPLNNFRDGLKNLEATITQRNQDRLWEYPYLLPSNIPMSTNI
ncbi:lipoxygenase family protein [Corynebacterium suicordis]